MSTLAAAASCNASNNEICGDIGHASDLNLVVACKREMTGENEHTLGGWPCGRALCSVLGVGVTN
jgi:hypothetical protein